MIVADLMNVCWTHIIVYEQNSIEPKRVLCDTRKCNEIPPDLMTLEIRNIFPVGMSCIGVIVKYTTLKPW